MVKRLFKRSIACLMAVLMIATSLPLTALADSTTDNVVVNKTVTAKNVRTGLVHAASRYKDSYYEIVNDSTNSSFSIGYWQYNTSDFSKATGEFTSAPFDINFQSSAFAGELIQAFRSVFTIQQTMLRITTQVQAPMDRVVFSQAPITLQMQQVITVLQRLGTLQEVKSLTAVQ